MIPFALRISLGSLELLGEQRRANLAVQVLPGADPPEHGRAADAELGGELADVEALAREPAIAREPERIERRDLPGGSGIERPGQRGRSRTSHFAMMTHVRVECQLQSLTETQ